MGVYLYLNDVFKAPPTHESIYMYACAHACKSASVCVIMYTCMHIWTLLCVCQAVGVAE